ncbi:MAG: family 43 glycosylhydrolase [Oscillospiraceae bacterium]|nr:family 43 glycosylhydrolase [Oscillospiraceae bacterium]
MKKQASNPFHPSWEYIPDGEPHVFGDRVYVYGSHDKFNGYVYCMNDYVCWSAPVNDLSDWRYEGVIYEKTSDPRNKAGEMNLFAPDVTKGPDGRYYLYYVLDRIAVVSVAVCDTPAGVYQFLGYVKDKNGALIGEREGDEPQFDPGVLTEGDNVYLYTGFCGHGMSGRTGAMGFLLERDMLTVIDGPHIVVPGDCYDKGTGFEGHAYFEAASIRKIDDMYYFVYSSVKMNELCYATSSHPLRDFKYGGAIISNCDMNIGTYKSADKPMNHRDANNHGGIEKIGDKWYVFYHRHTNGTQFSRQGCIEEIKIEADGSIKQVEITSQGANCGPLIGKGTYPAYMACNIFSRDDNTPMHLFPKITQDGADGDEQIGFVTNITDSTGVGFKYFDCKNIKRITLKTRGYNTGVFEVRISLNGEPLASVPIVSSNIWAEFSADIAIPDGIWPLYFVYKGNNAATLGAFTLETD